MSANNPRHASNFAHCFDYVYTKLAHTGAKFFILQCNEAITGEPIFWEAASTNKSATAPESRVVNPSKSLFETSNKTFFNKYKKSLLTHQCSFSIFLFITNYRVKVF